MEWTVSNWVGSLPVAMYVGWVMTHAQLCRPYKTTYVARSTSGLDSHLSELQLNHLRGDSDGRPVEVVDSHSLATLCHDRKHRFLKTKTSLVEQLVKRYCQSNVESEKKQNELSSHTPRLQATTVNIRHLSIYTSLLFFFLWPASTKHVDGKRE